MDKQEHKLNVLQSIVSRMAANSSNCKLWCITLLSAIIVLFLSDNINLGVNKIVVLIPIIPFMFLDAFYLGLERHFVEQYNKEFESNVPPECCSIKSIAKNKGCKRIKSTLKAMASFSVWGFYLVLCLTISIVLLIIDCKTQSR
jgi:beta-lactamase regulating signal transducer with metallopeptidase domain